MSIPNWLSAAHYQNMPHEEVNWAQLAQQWIAMREGGAGQSAPVMPAYPPPPPMGMVPPGPGFLPGHDASQRPPFDQTANGNAAGYPGHQPPPRMPHWDATQGPLPQSALPPHWNNAPNFPAAGPMVGQPPSQQRAPLLNEPVLAMHSTFDYHHGMEGHAASPHAEYPIADETMHEEPPAQWHDGGGGGPPFWPAPGMMEAAKSFPADPFGLNRSSQSPQPVPLFPGISSHDMDYRKLMPMHMGPMKDMDFPFLDVRQRKTLPAWIREGLEKMEREKAKQREKEEQERLAKEAKEKHAQERLKAGDPTASKFDEDSDESDAEKEEDAAEIEESDEENPTRKVEIAQRKSPSPARRQRRSRFSDPVKSEAADSSPQRTVSHRTADANFYGKSVDEIKQELMLKLRKWMTEILLEVTDDETQEICEAVFSSASRDRKSSADGVTSSVGTVAQKSSALAALSILGADYDDSDTEGNTSSKVIHAESDGESSGSESSAEESAKPADRSRSDVKVPINQTSDQIASSKSKTALLNSQEASNSAKPGKTADQESSAVAPVSKLRESAALAALRGRSTSSSSESDEEQHAQDMSDIPMPAERIAKKAAVVSNKVDSTRRPDRSSSRSKDKKKRHRHGRHHSSTSTASTASSSEVRNVVRKHRAKSSEEENSDGSGGKESKGDGKHRRRNRSPAERRKAGGRSSRSRTPPRRDERKRRHRRDSSNSSSESRHEKNGGRHGRTSSPKRSKERKRLSRSRSRERSSKHKNQSKRH